MIVPALPGADQIVEWLGGWTTFHDFYLLAAPAKGDRSGSIRVHGWITDWENTDSEGYFLTRGHGVVTFNLDGIVSVNVETEESMADFPAIVSELLVEPMGEEWCLSWTSSYGSEGQIVAKRVAITVEPGRPADAQPDAN